MWGRIGEGSFYEGLSNFVAYVVQLSQAMINNKAYKPLTSFSTSIEGASEANLAAIQLPSLRLLEMDQ